MHAWRWQISVDDKKMTTPAEVQASFKAALDEFEISDEQPDVNYYEKMVRAMFDVLIEVPYDEVGGTHNLVGIILEDPAYAKLYGVAFENQLAQKRWRRSRKQRTP